jgi:hypothetical protein
MKQSSLVISVLLANSAARQLRKPTNSQYFADGLEQDADIVTPIKLMEDGSMRVGENARAQANVRNYPEANAAPEKIEHHAMPHSNARTTYYGQHMSQQKFDANGEPEKLQTLIPEAYRNHVTPLNRNAPLRTTFYSQVRSAGEGGDSFNTNIEPEKLQTLIPEAYRTTANAGDYVFNLGEQRSTFFAQKEGGDSFNTNIEPEKLQTLIPEAYRTTANAGDYVFNLGEQRSTFFSQKAA